MFAINASLLDALLHAICEAVVVHDGNGRIVYCNASAKSLLGTEPGETDDYLPERLWGRTLHEDGSWFAAGEHPAAVTRRTGQPCADVVMGIVKDDYKHPIWLTVSAQPLSAEAGGTPFVVSTYRDITENKTTETKRLYSHKMEAIGTLAGGVAHDFNNVLGSIQGFAELIQTAPGKPNHEFAGRILEACDRGKSLVEQILAFAQTSAIRQWPVDIAALLRSNMALFSEGMPPNVRFTVDTSDAALAIKANAIQITQLVANLCANARDALDGKGGTITLSADLAPADDIAQIRSGMPDPFTRLFGELRDGVCYCRLRVSDNGPGIPEKMLDRIFEPFFTTKRRQHGTGLGLAMVHGVVLAHDGACHVQSSRHEGTSFTLYFPLTSEAVAVPAAPMPSEPNVGDNERVLIVDDEPDIVDSLAMELELWGYRAVGVENPCDALAVITEDPSAFDILISDQIMPGMLGTDLIAQAKRLNPDLIAILCTGFGVPSGQTPLSPLAADGVFGKPVGAAEMCAHIRAVKKARESGVVALPR